MSQATRICKICGCEYPYCKTQNKGDKFRYQDVACCPEHGTAYFLEIKRSRGELPVDETPTETASLLEVIEEPIKGYVEESTEEDDDNDDILLEDFDDYEDEDEDEE